MGSEGKEIKVTDKRMFTSDGELREEYRFLHEKSTAAADAPAPEASHPEPAAPPPPRREESRRADPLAPDPRGRAMFEEDEDDPSVPIDFPSTPPDLGPSFYDLVAMMAEPVPIYLGDVPLPDGQRADNLEMARVHIDLLDILRQKTAGNLTAQESAFLEDLLYRMRVRYVQKRG